jgi:molecular chaperone DnaK
MAKDNKQIGIFHLDGIAPAPRGIPQIEVSFDIDTNGILSVSAKDKSTGKEQHIRIEASSGLSDDEIKRMRDEAKANEDADKAAKERVDKINNADALCFQAEKFLKDNGDKVPADVKAEVESNLNPLKEAVKNQNISDIDRYSEALSKAFEKMYQAGAQAGQAGPQGGFDPNQGGPQGGPQGPGPDYGSNNGPDEQ